MADFLDFTVTPAVAAEQQRFYGRSQRPGHGAAPTTEALGAAEIEFIAARDSFYLGSISETGWPYIQHRGGPPGFLRVLAPDRLGFGDVPGNRQLLSSGNLAHNPRVALFLVDYPQRSRLKILGQARVIPAADDAALGATLAVEGLPRPERLFTIDVVAYDWNCPKYITPRYTVREVEEVVAPLRARIAELEAALKRNPR